MAKNYRKRHVINEGHEKPRNVLRTVGPVLVVIGGILVAIGIGSFFVAFGGGGSPRYFWCAFLGMPFLAAGGMMTKFGYMGKITRYMAEEMAPVGKDTFNYMADGTKDGVRTLAQAVGEGLRGGAVVQGEDGGIKIKCHKCNKLNDEEARFCDGCGTALAKEKACGGCGELNDPDAKFCDNCGNGF